MQQRQKDGEARVYSLRTRIVSATALAFAVMVAVLTVVFTASMRSMLAERESDNILNQARLSENILESSVGYLPSVTRDWSSWDNTYDYVQGRYDEFLDEYLTDYPFQLFRINLMAILRDDGEVVYQRFYDHRAGDFMQSPPDLSALYGELLPQVLAKVPAGKQATLADEIGTAGFVSHRNQIYYLSCYPVLHSDESGPAAGMFIFGRIVDSGEIAHITTGSERPFAVLTPDTFFGTEKERSTLLEEGSLVVAEGEKVTAYVAFNDIYGHQGLAVSLTSPRTLYRQGSNGINLIMLLVAAGCVAVLVVILLLLNRIVVRPLAELVRRVNGIDLDTVDTTLPPGRQNRELDELTGAVNGMLLRIRGSRDDIQARNEALYHLANYDQLTGLPNRRHATGLLQQLIDGAREKNDSVCLFFLDLGRFKHVNDTLGRDAGDEVIRQVAARLEGEMEGALLARYEGDKFLVGRGGLHTLGQRREYADIIFGLFKTAVEVRRRQMDIEVSIGSAVWPEDAPDAETLIKHAEIALYNAKETEGSRYQAYHEELHAELQRRVELEEGMRAAIAGGFAGFEMHFQPIINVKTGQVAACEALMRWRGPKEQVGPAEFIPLAEESGLIVPLTWWMLQSVCGQMRHFRQSGLDCSVSVNVTAQVLLHPEFLPKLQRAARDAEVPLSRLDVEIIEEMLVSDFARVNRVIGALHALGVRVSVDDFGTGYSSLSYLNRMHVDRIKIDQSFITRLAAGAEDQAIVEAILAVAGTLDMTVTAEGVETGEQLAFLKQAGCDEVQGFLFSRALPAGGFIEFATQWQQELERSKKAIGAPRAKAGGMPGIRQPKEPEPPRPEYPETGEEPVPEGEPPAAGWEAPREEAPADEDAPAEAPPAGGQVPTQ